MIDIVVKKCGFCHCYKNLGECLAENSQIDKIYIRGHHGYKTKKSRAFEIPFRGGIFGKITATLAILFYRWLFADAYEGAFGAACRILGAAGIITLIVSIVCHLWWLCAIAGVMIFLWLMYGATYYM